MKRLFKTALSIATVFIGMLFVNCNNDDSKNIEEPKLPNRHKLISLN